MAPRSCRFAACASLLFASTRASAEPQAAAVVKVDALAGYLGGVNRLKQSNVVGAPRGISDVAFPRSSGFALVGAGFGIDFVVNNRWLFPVIGFEAAMTVGPSERVVTGIDGSIAALEPWTAYNINMPLPGFGMRFTHRRIAYGFDARFGVSYVGMKADIASGREASSVGSGGLYSLSLLLRAEAFACGRVDPENRACVFMAPALYEYGWFNGGFAGVRWEYGP